MKLIFVTQVLDENDAVLGFVSRWVRGLAKHCEAVRVIALEIGETGSLPGNVDSRVVGRRGTLRRWLRYRRQLREAFSDGFDTVLTHMVPRYSVVADGLARKAGAGHYLWYTHKGVDGRLRRAVDAVDQVFTASAESMRIETPKRVVTGHGIDVEHFSLDAAPASPLRLLSVGRLTPAKDPITLLQALACLRSEGRELSLDWAGGGLAAGDDDYAKQVQAMIAELGLGGAVRMLGDVPYLEIPRLYSEATLLVSGSRTGSVDKVVLEAMAAGRPAVTCNESFPPLFAELGADAGELYFEPGDVRGLAGRIGRLLDRTPVERKELGLRLRAIVQRDHEVDSLMARLVGLMGRGRA